MNAFGSKAAASAVIILGMATVAVTQPKLAALAHEMRETEDVFAFPPPAQLHIATLGWDAAAVDLLWTKLLVDYGMHWSERREFTSIPLYVDSIFELEPTFQPLYLYVDTLLAYRPLQGTDEDVRKARAYLEQGTRVRPDDVRIWMEYGQFLAFIAPSFFKADAERAASRRAGAEAIGRAVELGGDPEKALSAATLLTQAGSKEMAIHYLLRAYELTPEASDAHTLLGGRLAALEALVFRDAADVAARNIRERHNREMPFFSRGSYLLLGPLRDAARCAGLSSSQLPECAFDWGDVVGAGKTTELGAASENQGLPFPSPH